MGPQNRRSLVLAALLLAAPLLHAQVFVVGAKTAEADAITEFHPTHVEIPIDPLTVNGHLDLIRNLEAEQGFAHRQLPLGAGLILQANGNMTPRMEAYKQMLYQKGQSVGPGERVEISALNFKSDRIVIDFNGGPYAKHRFLSHISFNNSPIAQLGPEVYGFRITLVFEKELPEITAAEVKALLDPLVDFKAKSSDEAYANTLTPKVRDSIQAHEILVGMDRRMVIAAVGEPKTKHREAAARDPADPNAEPPVLEEWIYGETPEAIQFVRFHDGKVSRLEIAALGRPIEIRDHNELDMTPAPALLARTISNGDAQRDASETHQRAQPPTLRRTGDTTEDMPTTTLGRVHLPGDTPAPNTPATPAPNTPTSSIPNASTPSSNTTNLQPGIDDTPPPPPQSAPQLVPLLPVPGPPHLLSSADRVN